MAPLFRRHAGLKELLMWPRGEWWELFWQGRLSPLSRKVLSFCKKLRGHHFDLVLDVQWLLKSAVLAWMTGARTRIGFPSKEPTGWSLTERVPSNLEPTISSEYRALAQYIGLQANEFLMVLPLSEAARGFAGRVYDGRPYAVFCPFTPRPQKHWPQAHWRSLTETALAQGWRIVLLSAPADRPAAQRIFTGQAVEDKVRVCSLDESAALVSQASLVIGGYGSDTHGLGLFCPSGRVVWIDLPVSVGARARGPYFYANLYC